MKLPTRPLTLVLAACLGGGTLPACAPAADRGPEPAGPVIDVHLNAMPVDARGPPPVDTVRRWFEEGRYRVMSEVTLQYGGVRADDPAFEPYLAVAEELDVPVGIHVGTGPHGAG